MRAGIARPASRARLLVLLAGTALLAAACTTLPPTAAPDLGFPSPLSGPGVPALAKVDAKLVEHGWTHLRAGDLAGALADAGKGGSAIAARLLALQAQLVDGREEVTGSLHDLVATVPGYAAAWLTLSVAAERRGDEASALSAAFQGASLWSKGAWQERADRLHRLWIEQRVADATRLLAAGEADQALALADRALAAEPGNRAATLERARVLIALGRSDEAEKSVIGLAGDPEALLLSGRIAEGRHDWETAMDLYGSLPAGYPDRAASLRRAKLEWRRSNLPPCAQQALSSPRLSRSQLANLLVSLAPQLEAVEGGSPPVLSDIVDLPCYREILTAVRLDLLDVDRFEHRFWPQRPATVEEVRGALEATCHVLGLQPPVWCEEGKPGGACTSLSEPITGEQVAALVSALTEAEEP